MTINVTAIQSLISLGDGLATKFVGTPYAFIRPDSAASPLGPPYATLPVFLTVDDKSAQTRANAYGKPLWYARYDRTITQVGDYFSGPQGTFFVAAQQSLLTTLAVECNRTVTFLRAGGETEPPVSSAPPSEYDYSGRTDASDTTLMAGWPASVLIKTRGEAALPALPSDTKQALFEVLLPTFTGVILHVEDFMQDDLGNRYALSAVEVTDLGYRIYAQLTDT